jgi:hypothetical protein
MLDAVEGGRSQPAAAATAAPATAAAACAGGTGSEAQTGSLQTQYDTASGAPSGVTGGQGASSGGREQSGDGGGAFAGAAHDDEQQRGGGSDGEQRLAGGAVPANGELAEVKVEQGEQGHSRNVFRAWLGNIGLHRRTPEAGASPKQAAAGSGEHTAGAANGVVPAEAANGALEEQQQAAGEPHLAPLQAAAVAAAAAAAAAAGGTGNSLAGRKRALEEGSGAGGASQTTSVKVRRLDSLLADDAGTGGRYWATGAREGRPSRGMAFTIRSERLKLAEV